MRRTLGYLAFVVGVVLIALSPLLRWYAYPRVAKAPTDVYDRSNTIGTGTYFDAKTLQPIGPDPLVNATIAKGDPQASTHDIVVISINGKTYDKSNGNVLSYSQDNYVMDRVTGYAVHCCGEYPRHEGLTLKFPFNTEKRTYLFYDSTALKAFPASYTRTEEVAGLQCYVFVSRVPQTLIGSIGLPGKLASHPDTPSVTTDRYYQAVTTLWVEPFTGAIIKVKQDARQWLTDSAGLNLMTVADTHFHSSQADIDDTASQIRTKFSQLQLVRNVLPLWGPIGGLILAVVGAVLLIGRRRKTGASSRGAPATGPSAVEASV